MPIEENLPAKVIMYLDLISQITQRIGDLDSCLPESKIFMIEIEHYFTMIRKEMAKIAEEI
jgi:hypothetical protein